MSDERTERMMCPACMFKGMYAAMDKKSRPFLRCEVCSAIIFVRVGALGVHTVHRTLRLLDRPELADEVRSAAYADVNGPAQGLAALLGLRAATEYATAHTSALPVPPSNAEPGKAVA